MTIWRIELGATPYAVPPIPPHRRGSARLPQNQADGRAKRPRQRTRPALDCHQGFRKLIPDACVRLPAQPPLQHQPWRGNLDTCPLPRRHFIHGEADLEAKQRPRRKIIGYFNYLGAAFRRQTLPRQRRQRSFRPARSRSIGTIRRLARAQGRSLSQVVDRRFVHRGMWECGSESLELGQERLDAP